MKAIFYVGLIGLALFEVLNVYFIMPMPGSQEMDSVDLAYFLYSYRWIFRGVFTLVIVAGSYAAFKSSIWIPVIAILPVVVIMYVFNFKMTADKMFRQPETLIFGSKAGNALSDSSLVIAVYRDFDAKAYPIRYIQYHHQVRDTLAGMPIMVTYCNVCRTGRVFEPVVDGKPENFRLVGMDHFNAMFEDEATGSWWRQATGEAVTGPLKGKALPEVESTQLTLNRFFALYPFGRVMQAETISQESYDTLGRFEKGRSKGHLTRTDSLSWNSKSWVVGVVVGDHAKAYDWNDLRKMRVIHDEIASTPVAVVLSSDDQSFVAFRREKEEQFIIRNDSLVGPSQKFDFAGRSSSGDNLRILNSYQEFWHSWKQFHPATEVYQQHSELGDSEN